MDDTLSSPQPSSPFCSLYNDTCSSPPSSPLTGHLPPLLDQKRMERALLVSALSSRPHPLRKSQIESISHYITQSDPALSAILQVILGDLVTDSSPTEHAFLMHTLAAAASFYEATNSRAPCPPQAVEHYSSAIELMPRIQTPCLHLDILNIVLEKVLEMAQSFIQHS